MLEYLAGLAVALRADKDVVVATIEALDESRTAEALQHAGEDMRGDREVMLSAVMIYKNSS